MFKFPHPDKTTAGPSDDRRSDNRKRSRKPTLAERLKAKLQQSLARHTAETNAYLSENFDLSLYVRQRAMDWFLRGVHLPAGVHIGARSITVGKSTNGTTFGDIVGYGADATPQALGDLAFDRVNGTVDLRRPIYHDGVAERTVGRWDQIGGKDRTFVTLDAANGQGYQVRWDESAGSAGEWINSYGDLGPYVVGKEAGDPYSSVAAAVADVATAAPSDMTPVYVKPGFYPESAFTLPNNCIIVGLQNPRINGEFAVDSAAIIQITGGGITVSAASAFCGIVGIFLTGTGTKLTISGSSSRVLLQNTMVLSTDGIATTISFGTLYMDNAELQGNATASLQLTTSSATAYLRNGSAADSGAGAHPAVVTGSGNVHVDHSFVYGGIDINNAGADVFGSHSLLSGTTASGSAIGSAIDFSVASTVVAAVRLSYCQLSATAAFPHVDNSGAASQTVNFNGVTFIGSTTGGEFAANISNTPFEEESNASHLRTFEIEDHAPLDGEVLIWDNAASQYRPGTVSSGGAVTSVFGRTGAVVAQASDYDGNQVDNTPANGISATDVQGAINEIAVVDITAGTGITTSGDIGNDNLTVGLELTTANVTFTGTTYTFPANALSVGAPTLGSSAVNKDYVDQNIAGLDWKDSAVICSVLDIGGSFNSSGGTTGTGEFTNVDLTSQAIWDDLQQVGGGAGSLVLAVGDRVLVKSQSTPAQNGLYEVTTAGATGVIERTSDQSGVAPNEIEGGNAAFVDNGATCNTTAWVVQGDGVITVNVGAVNWVQFAGANVYTGGDGIDVTGSVISVDLAATSPGLEFLGVTPAGELRLSAQGNGIAGGAGSLLSVDPGGDGADVVPVTVAVAGVGLDLTTIDGNGLTTSGAGELQVQAVAAGGINVTGTGIEVVESELDHNSLNNLAVGDVHTQYAYLAGRSGGQNLIGGTDASDNLILQSTSNATKGDVIIGTASESNPTHLLPANTHTAGVGQTVGSTAARWANMYAAVFTTGDIRLRHRRPDGSTNGGAYTLVEHPTGVYLRNDRTGAWSKFLTAPVADADLPSDLDPMPIADVDDWAA